MLVHSLLFILFIFISKGLLVIDEETLVVITFVLFLIFTFNNVSTSIANTLDERSQQIKSLLEKEYKLNLYLLESYKSQIKNTNKLFEVFYFLCLFFYKEYCCLYKKSNMVLYSSFKNTILTSLGNILKKEDTIVRHCLSIFSKQMNKEIVGIISNKK